MLRTMTQSTSVAASSSSSRITPPGTARSSRSAMKLSRSSEVQAGRMPSSHSRTTGLLQKTRLDRTPLLARQPFADERCVTECQGRRAPLQHGSHKASDDRLRSSIVRVAISPLVDLGEVRDVRLAVWKARGLGQRRRPSPSTL